MTKHTRNRRAMMALALALLLAARTAHLLSVAHTRDSSNEISLRTAVDIQPTRNRTTTTTTTTTTNEDVVVYNLGPRNIQGFGSLVMNAMVLGLYYEYTQGRTLIINEQGLTKYRWNETHGIFSGPLFPTVRAFPDGLPRSYSRAACRKSRRRRDDASSQWQPTACPVLQYRSLDAQHDAFRAHVKSLSWLHDGGTEKDNRHWQFFRLLSAYTCRTLPPTVPPPTLQTQIQTMTKSLPQHFELAFHVRRTDKILEIGVEYPIADYVAKAVQLTTGTTSMPTPRNCFVATDDDRVVSELRDALQDAGLRCQLWTLTAPEYEPTAANDDNDDWMLLLFLAQLQVLVEADYFVGTFSSNVASLVAIWRGCRRSNQEDDPIRQQHYFQSFGVDSDRWMFL